MALLADFPTLFSSGKYQQCTNLTMESSIKGDNMISQWINSVQSISSKFMSVYLEDVTITEQKTRPLVIELQSLIHQIRSPAVNDRLLKLELCALYNLLYMKTFSNNILLEFDTKVKKLTKATLIRVIYRHYSRPCSDKEDISELLVTALQSIQEDDILSALVNFSCLWIIIKCQQDKKDEVIQVLDLCLTLQKSKIQELSPLMLLPLPLLLTGQQYVSEILLSDLVHVTAGLVYYKRDDQKSMECLDQVVSTEFKPYTVYLISSLQYNTANYVEALTTLYSLSTDIAMTDRIKAIHCHLFGMTLSKLGKHRCAVQKYKKALDHDFTFLLPLYNISVEYKSMNTTPAELESLNLLTTALQNSNREQFSTPPSLFTRFIEDMCGELTSCQVLYKLAYRCSELKMYDDAAERYLDVLAYLHGNSIIKVSGNSLIEVPSTKTIYLEAIHCLNQANKYNECIAVCDKLLSCLPLQSQNASVSFNIQSDVNLISDDFILENEEGKDFDASGSQDNSKRKRINSEEFVKDDKHEHELVAQLYKADCLVFLGNLSVAVECLDRCCDNLPFSAEASNVLRVHQQSKRQRIDSSGEATSQCDVSKTVGHLQKLASSVYCHLGVAVATKGQVTDALHFLRIGLRLNIENLDVLYNYVVVLWSVNKKEAAVSWCQGRDIEAADSFHMSSVLKQKQNKLRSMTGQDFFKESDLKLDYTVTDESLLKLDVLCLNFLIFGNNSK